MHSRHLYALRRLCQNCGHIHRNGNTAFLSLVFNKFGINYKGGIGTEAVNLALALYSKGVGVISRSRVLTRIFKE